METQLMKAQTISRLKYDGEGEQVTNHLATSQNAPATTYYILQIR